MRHASLRSWAAAALAVATVASCATHGPRYLDPNMDFGAVRTVAVMPFTNLSRENTAGERVRDVFSTALISTGALMVVPPGEVQRAISGQGVVIPSAPSVEEVGKLGKVLKADAIITGTVREYGEVSSGSARGNVVSVSVQMMDAASGKVIWTAASTRGGVTLADRLLGSSGTPMNRVTEEAVDDLLRKLFD